MDSPFLPVVGKVSTLSYFFSFAFIVTKLLLPFSLGMPDICIYISFSLTFHFLPRLIYSTSSTHSIRVGLTATSFFSVSTIFKAKSATPLFVKGSTMCWSSYIGCENPQTKISKTLLPWCFVKHQDVSRQQSFQAFAAALIRSSASSARITFVECGGCWWSVPSAHFVYWPYK